MKNIVLIISFMIIGLIGCMPIDQGTEIKEENDHMARCHGKGHHHNPRHDHTAECLSDRGDT